MIYITRPVTETHKIVPKTSDKSLDNDLREKKSNYVQWEEDKRQGQSYETQRGYLEEAVEETNQMIFKDDRRFEFRIHEGTKRIMVKLIDNETDEIVKEIPPEKILDLVASIWDLVGILVDERG
ncbi:MAG: flagellar protein FlaG [Tissierellaceae bacterium]